MVIKKGISKVDLVMWTKNGEKTLPMVLDRIDKIIPSKNVHRRIIVDDNSKDRTREIAKSFGWEVIFNEGIGIADGANTALKHVSSDYFISFEQDLLLAHDWWQKIPIYLTRPKVAIASGIRISKGLETFAKLEMFSMERHQKAQKTGELTERFFYGKTLDNTIYKTEVIRKIGGFPKLEASAGVDNVLAYRIHLADYQWVVDYSVISNHLRKGLKDELAHRYWYGTCYDLLDRLLGVPYSSLNRQILRLLFSPIRGLQVGVKKKDLRATYVYPLMRYNILKGIVDSRKMRRR